jgi:hypothetical protein
MGPRRDTVVGVSANAGIIQVPRCKTANRNNKSGKTWFCPLLRISVVLANTSGKVYELRVGAMSVKECVQQEK